MKRKLSKKEINICQHSIKRMQERVNYLQYLDEYTILMLKKGLQYNEKNKLRELDAQMEVAKENKEIAARRRRIHALTFEIMRIQMEEDLGKIASEISGIIKDIQLLDDQMKNGVEVKEKKEEPLPSGVG